MVAVRPAARPWWVLLPLLLITLPAPAAPGAPELPPAYAAWLEAVAPLISQAEREAFLALTRDYQRDAFIEAFWRFRDPFPETARNEFRERWEERVEAARERFGHLADERARILLLHGEPASEEEVSCGELLDPLLVWRYAGSDASPGVFTLVFHSPGGGRRGPFRLWYPSHGLDPLLSPLAPRASRTSREEGYRLIVRDCPRGGEIVALLSQAEDPARVTAVDLGPRPGEEWAAAFKHYPTEVPPGAETFDATLTVSFPGSRQSRTLVQGLLTVAAGAPGEDGGRAYVLDGEVLRKGELFEQFRYRFRFGPEDEVEERLPLAFQRYLRPGAYTLILRLEEVAAGAFFRRELPLEVPRVRSGPAAAEPAAAAGAAPAAGAATDATAPAVPPAAPRLNLAEANAAIGSGEHAIKLLPPPPELLVGKARFDALAQGPGIARVRFFLDGGAVLAKTRPPWSVELDLGRAPRVHTLRAVALDAEGRELAADEIRINAGPHRFSVRLIEPQPGARYAASLMAHAAVEVPEGERLARLELYREESLVATLFQPPFIQPILLPQAGGASYVRAVAYLDDGNSTEDAVFINAPDYGEKLKVQLVELYATVVDRRKRPVEGLAAADFEVLEDGEPQAIRRFEQVRDRPVYAGVLVDTSLSMIEELREAMAGALRFFNTVITRRDRAAVITFSDQPHLAVRFTNDPQVLAGGLSGLSAAGNTVLYDSIIYALHYFSGVKGRRALILLSDGIDEGSRYRFDDALEYARRTGVAIYPVGLGIGNRASEIRLRLQRLAGETGGRTFYVDRAAQLGPVYEAVEAELRSQYLIAYQSSHLGDDGRYREVEVRTGRPGLEVKTMRGYYP